MKNTNIPIFGKKNPDAAYEDRPGAYGLLLNNDNQLGTIVMDNQYYFLPGGGKESGETILECLERELLEELGCAFTYSEHVSTANEYVKSFNEEKYYFIIGHYFLINNFQIVGKPTDTSHEVFWMPLEKAPTLLHRDAQKWVINNVFK